MDALVLTTALRLAVLLSHFTDLRHRRLSHVLKPTLHTRKGWGSGGSWTVLSGSWLVC